MNKVRRAISHSNGYALKLNLGKQKYHITMVYFKYNRRLSDYEVDQIKEIGNTFLVKHVKSILVPLELGKMFVNGSGKSVLVIGELANIKKNLMVHFISLDYPVDVELWGQTAHINVHGNVDNIKEIKEVNLFF